LNYNLSKFAEVAECFSKTSNPLNYEQIAGDCPSASSSDLLIELFDELFVPSLQTCLCGGSEEPIYLPACETGTLNEIHFTRNYFASALHEIAHWCVAGPERLKQVDYGYWYAPDGRTQAQQLEFEQVEVKPQALEWIFSAACGSRFNVSADNLALGVGPSEVFKQAVFDQVVTYCKLGLPRRADVWLTALNKRFKVADPLAQYHYQRDSIGE
jgi:elongation factor P hydroxylase